ncbi:redoxin domain-containing protein [Halovenus rubra]|uniref:Redoxin domain-containing protein n=2 Tax=Halovenus rubra TaxID=869890 RepID=A0ACC7E2J6_9EURY|nr:redoxin domain-containing protein [Halovenus rubra]
MLSTGSAAPNFTLPGTSPDSDQPTEYTLSAALETGPVVLNFYLFDFHPACTEHMCDLHELAWFDLNDDVTVFGISTDRTFSHQAFAESEELDIRLLSDSDGTVAEAYDALYDEFKGHKRIAKRSVYVVDTAGNIAYAWQTESPQEQPDWSEVRDALDSLVGTA